MTGAAPGVLHGASRRQALRSAGITGYPEYGGEPLDRYMISEEQHADSQDRAVPGKGKKIRYNERPSGKARRGYAAVALEGVTDPINVGHTLRAVMCFDAEMVVIGTAEPLDFDNVPTDPGRTWRHTPVIQTPDVFEALPYGAVPVAIELTDDAIDLTQFVHPERGFYIFGPENGSVSRGTIDRCKHVVKVPTRLSLNLGATVHVVLYDRLQKTSRAHSSIGTGDQ